jgi:hypothetical protein
MNARTGIQRSWVLLLAVSVLTVHGSGLHVHVCQDGQEPPAVLHFEDNGIHAEHGAEQHQDLELSLDDGLTKTVKAGLDSPALVNTAGVFFHLVLDAVAESLANEGLNPAHPARFVRPQLRAPPL